MRKHAQHLKPSGNTNQNHNEISVATPTHPKSNGYKQTQRQAYTQSKDGEQTELLYTIGENIN